MKKLPPLISSSDIYTNGNGLPQCETFGIDELGRRIEQQLLRNPEFQSPYTTTDRPAHILDYTVLAPDENGVCTAMVDFLPGSRVQEFYQWLAKEEK